MKVLIIPWALGLSDHMIFFQGCLFIVDYSCLHSHPTSACFLSPTEVGDWQRYKKPQLSCQQFLSHTVLLPSPYSYGFLITSYERSSPTLGFCQLDSLRSQRRLSSLKEFFMADLLFSGRDSIACSKNGVSVLFSLYHVLFWKYLSWSAKCSCKSITLMAFHLFHLMSH